MRGLLALLLSGLISFASADESRFGRLFYTPEERTALEMTRQHNQPQREAHVEDAAAPSALTLNGVVKRSDGKGTAWVNGHPIQEGSLDQGLLVGRLPPDAAHVFIKPSSDKHGVRLKAGQHYDPVIGKVSETTFPVISSEAPSP